MPNAITPALTPPRRLPGRREAAGETRQVAAARSGSGVAGITGHAPGPTDIVIAPPAMPESAAAPHGAGVPEDCYLLNLQLSGRGRIMQDGGVLTLAPLEIAVVDGRRPFRIELAESANRILFLIPRDMADRRAPWLRRRPIGKIMTADSPYAELARQHLVHLAAGGRSLDEAAVSLLIDNLFNLFTLANQPDGGGARRASSTEQLLAFCRRHLHEAQLSPQLVAAHFGISVRTLHLRFEQLGESFNRWLLATRLDACGDALHDPNWRGRTIADVAFRFGFNDLSHFNRTFRSRFAATPRQWRARGRAGDRQPDAAPADFAPARVAAPLHRGGDATPP